MQSFQNSVVSSCFYHFCRYIGVDRYFPPLSGVAVFLFCVSRVDVAKKAPQGNESYFPVKNIVGRNFLLTKRRG